MRTRAVRQIDIVEWFKQQNVALRTLRKYRATVEKGFVAYAKDARDFIKEMRSDKKADTPDDAAAKEASNRSLNQHYQSQELLKRMKWKRVTWEDTADYDGFAQRITENDSMFSKCPAFSFMSLYVAKDPSTTNIATGVKTKSQISVGDLTNWLIQERKVQATKLYSLPDTSSRRSAFTVDWVAGEARILDTASAQEILTFLTTIAPRLQSLQVRMEDQQQKIIADVENARVRLGITKLKYNKGDASYWDDPRRQTDTGYVNPDELRMFLDGALRSAFLFRLFLKGQEVRVVKPGRPYHINQETKEIEIPANFAEFNWLPIHKRFQNVEKFFDFFRNFWWIWFSLSLVIIGDVELI